jgi:hypothetical protein
MAAMSELSAIPGVGDVLGGGAKSQAQALRQKGDVAGAQRLEQQAQGYRQQAEDYGYVANDRKSPKETPEQKHTDPGKGSVAAEAGSKKRKRSDAPEVAEHPQIELADGWEFDTKGVIKATDTVAGQSVPIKTKEGASSEAIPKKPISLDATEGSKKPLVEKTDKVPGTSTHEADTTKPISIDMREGSQSAVNALEKGKTYHVGVTNDRDPVGYSHRKAPFGWQKITSLESDCGRMYPELKKNLKGVEVGSIFTGMLRSLVILVAQTDIAVI